jgi:hypothetical protein
MKKNYLLKQLLIVAVLFSATIVGSTVLDITSNVQAATVDEVKEFTGVLEANPSSAYTHKVGNIDLILNNSHNKYLGWTVTVRVQYYNAWEFNVLSITPIRSNTTTTSSKYNNGDIVKFQGVLEYNTSSNYTHQIDNINFILNSSYNAYVGQEVRITVVYYNAYEFTVSSVEVV